jgi:hypothetical protein
LEFVETIPREGPSRRIALQLCDAATSVGANYRALCRSRSDEEFAAKVGAKLCPINLPDQAVAPTNLPDQSVTPPICSTNP